jgi:hypothetical protein
MADIKEKFGSNGQAITITVASLTNTSARASTVIDNSTTLFLDALVFLKLKSGASSTTPTGTIRVYAYATVDGGTLYTEGASGSDAALTLVSPTNLVLLGVINMVANATTYYGGPFSVAQAFGGVLPEKWGIVIENQSGGTLDSTGANHLAEYEGVYANAA